MAQPETAFDTVTRIAAGDDKTRYDNVSIALHWTTAALVLIQFVLAQTWGWFGRPTHHSMVVLHMSFGVVLTVVVVGRLIWRLVPGHALEPLALGWMETASRAVHWLLYALLFAEIVLGFITRWAEAPMAFFGLEIPSPFASYSKPTHHQAKELHDKVAWAIVIVAVLHALAALYHHYQLRDRVLVRMAPWAREPGRRA